VRKVDVDELMQFFTEFYQLQGFEVAVPPPIFQKGDVLVAMNDSMLAKGLSEKKALFYRPSSKEVPFDRLMRSLYGSSGWIIDTDDERRQETSWDFADDGYWFWVDMDDSPYYLKTESEIGDDERTALMSVEEYLIVFSALICRIPSFTKEHPQWLPAPVWLRTISSGRHLTGCNGYRFTLNGSKPASVRTRSRLG